MDLKKKTATREKKKAIGKQIMLFMCLNNFCFSSLLEINHLLDKFWKIKDWEGRGAEKYGDYEWLKYICFFIPPTPP